MSNCFGTPCIIWVWMARTMFHLLFSAVLSSLSFFFSPLTVKQQHRPTHRVWNLKEPPVIPEQTAIADIRTVSVEPLSFIIIIILFPICRGGQTDSGRGCWLTPLIRLPQAVCPMEEDAWSPVSLCSAPPHSQPAPPSPPLPSVTPRYSSTRTPAAAPPVAPGLFSALHRPTQFWKKSLWIE